MDISIIIPTYNGATRLPAVLEALCQQCNIETLQGDIWVVDNNSTDDTAAVVRQYQETWSFAFPLHYIKETRQGAGYARQHGLNVSEGKLLGLLDDDNWPEPTWVSEAVAFAQAHPQAGAFGSSITGKFETPPPAAWKPILHYLAIVERGEVPHQYCPRKNGTPPSAGLVVRREAWLQAVPADLLLVGRVGKSMLAGEDSEILTYLHRAGWEIWHNAAMKVSHYIPSSRLQWSYLRENLLGIGLCRYHIRMLILPSWQRPGMTLVYGLSDSLKLLRHVLKHGQRVNTDVVANCQWALLWGTLISPLYLLRVRLQRSRLSIE
ncbi:MAG: glycosyltransferase family 2 protein [Leptolyngbya sp. SIO1E4]|nr:glycosyltransferase family 2 protein [Leptolyngbya sp. SIO1E4]